MRRTIRAAQIAAFVLAPTLATAQPNPQVSALQQQFMSDPATMQRIMELQDDPLVGQILQDPETLRAIQSGDLDRLVRDPKIRAMMQHETVQDLSR